jgi:type IV pilus assembly protein PilA
MMYLDPKRRRAAGFSLIELLIVIAIILIILAVALPKLNNARRYAQEMAAVKAISTLHTAEAQYYSQYGGKGGFKFNLQPSQSGYSVVVTPEAYGASGTHTYYSDQSMSIHQHSGQEPATANDPLLGERDTGQQQSK